MSRRGVAVGSVIVALCVVAVAPARALAQSAPASPASPTARVADNGYIDQPRVALEIDDCGVKPDAPADRLRAIASEHYQRGEVLYVQGDYRGAVNELVASYCLLPYFSVLKDIGQAYERQLDYPRAIAYLTRYIKDIPDDAKQAAACGVDPQADRTTVSARIQVLSELPARILVDTQPTGAAITLTSEGGVTARATSGQPIEVRGGRYQLVIEKSGYRRVERPIVFEIGKPYTLFEALEPVKGKMRVQVTPNDARVFLDNRFVGFGRYEAELPAGTYSIESEADGHVTTTRAITVLPDREVGEVIELPSEPQVGRRQLTAYAAVGGGVAGGFLLAATKVNGAQVVAGGAGAIGGFVTAHYGLPDNQPLGPSSLTITSSLAGGVAGAAIAQMFTPGTDLEQTLAGTGLLVGAGLGYWAGTKLDITPGDAALVNSGALWGAVAGTLFTVTFDSGNKVSGGLVLAGLSMGGIGGALLAHTVPVTRTHAALIDVGGIAGILAGLAIESVAYQSEQSGMAVTEIERERLSNFALGGMAVGLITAGVLTRNVDAPKLDIAPTIGGAVGTDGKTTMTYGLGGNF